MSGSQTRSSLFTMSIPRFLIWASVFYLALNWQGIIPVWTNAELVGPDDFLRLSRVRDWLNGQGWFDPQVLRLSGSDLHWSRIADVPIATLAIVCGLIFGQEQGLVAASIAWPFLLFLLSVLLLVRITDRLAGPDARLFVLVFAAFNAFTMVEFVPGRVDHHNLQMVLLLVAVAGLFERCAWITALAIGISVPLSVGIGLEMLFLLAPVLAGLGISWAFSARPGKQAFARTGLVLMTASILLFLTTVPATDWAIAHCDAYSPVYAFLLVGAGAGFLLAEWLCSGQGTGLRHTLAGKLLIGAVMAGILALVAVFLYPQCMAGPMAGLDPEAARRWLAEVTEAGGLFETAMDKPERWISGVGYILLLIAIATWVTGRHWRTHPQLLTLLLVLMICVAVSLIQVRVLRTGLVASIPFLAIFAADAFSRIGDRSITTSIAKVSICIILASYSWSIAAMPLAAIWSKQSSNIQSPDRAVPDQGKSPALRNPNACFGRHDFSVLTGLPEGKVMSDLNSATPLLFHSSHSTISGPYHRNDREILAVYDFFQSDPSDAHATARALGIEYVATCRASGGIPVNDPDHLNARIWRDDLPSWLQWWSSPGARLAVLEVLP